MRANATRLGEAKSERGPTVEKALVKSRQRMKPGKSSDDVVFMIRCQLTLLCGFAYATVGFQGIVSLEWVFGFVIQAGSLMGRN